MLWEKTLELLQRQMRKKNGSGRKIHKEKGKGKTSNSKADVQEGMRS